MGRVDEKSLYYYPVFLGFLIHVLYEVLFVFVGINSLALYNIVSILVFGVGSYILRKDDNEKIIFLCFLEVSFFVVISTLILGWEHSFQNWLFAISILGITVPFKNKKPFNFLILLNAVIYVILYVIVLKKFDLEQISFLDLVFVVFNILGAFFLIVFSERVLDWSNVMQIYFLKMKYNDMKEKAYTDELTGLLNRYSINEQLDEMNEKINKDSEKFYLCFIDIDNFKTINDTYGHDVGDRVLQSVASIFKENLRDGDLVARWGGEEFLMLIRNDRPIFEFLDNIRQKISETYVEDKGNKINFTVTIGAKSSMNVKNVYDMKVMSDEIMYRGKSSGKNVVLVEE